MNNQDLVILVHGLCGSPLDMWPISRHLRQLGYTTRNWGYRSLGRGIETHVERFSHFLSGIDREVQGARFHLVTHSMGGIIARAVFSQQQFQNPGRVVMLAPPHRGSHAARRLKPFLGWVTPSLGQLSDQADSYVNRLTNPFPEQQIPFGIVRASRDRVIKAGAELLDGYRDFACVKGQHGLLPWYPQTTHLVGSFLKSGRFESAASVRTAAVAGDSESQDGPINGSGSFPNQVH